MVGSVQQRAFGQHKLDSLPQVCRDCAVRFACNGGCPKNRFIETPDGQPGLNYLCEGYKLFFHHINQPMRVMAHELRQNRPAARVMAVMQQAERDLAKLFGAAKRNEPYPCGSGRKFKLCHAQ